ATADLAGRGCGGGAAGWGGAGVRARAPRAEGAEPLAGWLRSAGLDTIFLVAPTSPDSRIASIAERSSGFVYCVTLKGVTGARAELAAGLSELLGRVRQATGLPVAAGFGISRPDHVPTLRGHAGPGPSAGGSRRRGCRRQRAARPRPSWRGPRRTCAGAAARVPVRGIRGATTAAANDAEAIVEATERLLRELVTHNQLDVEEIAL